MIASPFIAEWSQFVSWAAVEQVEQDLTLSRLIVEIANDDFLGNELVFRGGTCLHKLHLPPGLRYSEDLDYVRRSAGGIREMVDALRSIGERLGMRVNVDVTKFPRVRFRAPFESGTGVMRIKIEINTAPWNDYNTKLKTQIASGDALNWLTAMPPADSPMIVTLPGLPPKAAIFF